MGKKLERAQIFRIEKLAGGEECGSGRNTARSALGEGRGQVLYV